MAVFTLTVTNPAGVDLSLFFPGLLGTRWSSAGYTPTSGNSNYRIISNGVVDETKSYSIDTTGKDYAFSRGDAAVGGTITSATLSVTPMGGTKTPLAALSIDLGSYTTTNGGVPIPSILDMTPASLMRYADRLDSDRAMLVLKGADGNDKLPGSQWSDILDGGRGIDWLEGLGGDDLYYVDNQGDAVREDGGEGLDTVFSTVTYRLAEGTSVEILQAFPSSGRIGLTGNSFSNQIFGNESANRLDGGTGNDALTGGLGKDVFLFTSKLSKTGNVDQILDFRVVDDSIWLENSIFKGLGKAGSLTKPAKLDSDAFIAGNRAHDREDRIIYNKTTGALSYDPDGTGSSSQIKFAQLTKGLHIKASDFFVI